jgi:minichromosome maintenance protein 10
MDSLEPKSAKTAKTVQNLGPRGKTSTNGNLGTSNKKTVTEAETRARTDDDDKNFSKDRFSSLRIINPLISSVVMENRMEGRRMVNVSQIPTKIKGNNDIDGDWVTIGVIVQKLPPKKSSNVRISLFKAGFHYGLSWSGSA